MPMPKLPGKQSYLLLVLALASMGAAFGQGRGLPRKPMPVIPVPQPAGPQAQSYYFYCIAQDAAMRRDYPSSRDNLKAAVALDPKSPELRMDLARMHARLQEHEAAMKEAEMASSLDPGAIPPRKLVIELLSMRLSRENPLDDSEFQAAVSAHIDLLALSPDDGQARVGLGQLYFERGQYMQAAEILRPHVTAVPEAIEASHLLAQALMRAGEPVQARDVLEKAASDNPEFPELQRALAEAMHATGDVAGSLKLLEKLVAKHPDRHSLRFELARMYQDAGRFDDGAMEAARLVRTLASAERGSSQEAALGATYVLLIEALSRGGAMDRAIESTLEAERRFPGESRFPLKRAEILFIEGRTDEGESILSAQRARSGGPNKNALSMVLLRAGAFQESKGKQDEAESFLEKALEIDSGNHAALNYLGYMLADRDKNLERALELIEKAVLLDINNGSYQDSLGWALFRLGRYDDALEPLQRGAELIPEEGVVHDHLGDLHWVEERWAAAISSWEEALERGVDYPEKIRKKLKQARTESNERR
jgi:tetratricopeptide (TPR) repeat protein